MRYLLIMGLVALAASLLAGTASATSLGQIDLDYDTVSPWGLVNIKINTSGETPPIGSTTGWEINHNVLAGVYRLWLGAGVTGDPNKLVLGNPNGPGRPTTLEAQMLALGATYVPTNTWRVGTFCMDALQNVNTGLVTYDIQLVEDSPVGVGNTPIGEAKADDLRELFGTALPMPLLYLTQADAVMLQAMVWEIVHEDRSLGYNLSTGNVRVSGLSAAGAATANGYLADILNEDLDKNYGIRALVRLDSQDFVLEVPGVGGEPIPEPVTLFGIFSGLVGVGVYVRRRFAA